MDDKAKLPVTIAISGAAGQISYSLLFRLIAGDLLGPHQPIVLRLLEVPQAIGQLEGVAMELEDFASPILVGLSCHSDPLEAFKDVDLAFLVGARPRGPGMERADLLEVNAEIFAEQGRALNAVAKRSVKVLVVGNPVNTNTLIAVSNAPDLDPSQFSGMTRLDHNRAVSLLARTCQRPCTSVEGVIIWGNHSTSQYPDLHHATINGRPVLECVGMDFEASFIETVRQRGAEVIRVRGKSSAASGAHAALCQMRDWLRGTPKGSWTSMAVVSDGSYGVTQGLVFSFPVETHDGHWRIVEGLALDAASEALIKASEGELLQERDLVQHLIALPSRDGA
ncbi:MAG: malate dehydrogenase [Gammaproteobacteria bacterium]|nr:malate dehydrogenase [Gammaproteobacteria bacterium]NBT45033.1 malate dehydrogenase [Gammaproteobacteria bacterium]NBY24009.1 malate dehydrogenase [Gammaproteobacteria bacterium]NDE34101.1 malate dehydrogenase [Gammaproteobacteria bacterium]NDE55991.1 malate dehydrogenase [Gammaproteobacteria bacterium]